MIHTPGSDIVLMYIKVVEYCDISIYRYEDCMLIFSLFCDWCCSSILWLPCSFVLIESCNFRKVLSINAAYCIPSLVNQTTFFRWCLLIGDYKRHLKKVVWFMRLHPYPYYITCSSVASGIKLFVEWFKIYHGNKMDDKLRTAKKELDTKLLNQEIDDKNKQFHERLQLLQKK